MTRVSRESHSDPDPNVWLSYEDLMVDDEAQLLPVHGVRILLAVDDSGHTQLRWDVVGAPDVHALVGMLEQCKFIYQLSDIAYADGQLVEEDDGQDELPGLS